MIRVTQNTSASQKVSVNHKADQPSGGGQIELFASVDTPRGRGGRASRQLAAPANPHLLAARRLARRMRRLPEHSVEETRTGLAICRQLKAFLQDEPRRSTAS